MIKKIKLISKDGTVLGEGMANDYNDLMNALNSLDELKIMFPNSKIEISDSSMEDIKNDFKQKVDVFYFDGSFRVMASDINAAREKMDHLIEILEVEELAGPDCEINMSYSDDETSEFLTKSYYKKY